MGDEKRRREVWVHCPHCQGWFELSWPEDRVYRDSDRVDVWKCKHSDCGELLKFDPLQYVEQVSQGLSSIRLEGVLADTDFSNRRE